MNFSTLNAAPAVVKIGDRLVTFPTLRNRHWAELGERIRQRNVESTEKWCDGKKDVKGKPTFDEVQKYRIVEEVRLANIPIPDLVQWAIDVHGAHDLLVYSLSNMGGMALAEAEELVDSIDMLNKCGLARRVGGLQPSHPSEVTAVNPSASPEATASTTTSGPSSSSTTSTSATAT